MLIEVSFKVKKTLRSSMQSVYSIPELQRTVFKVITLVFLEKVTFLSSASSIIWLAVHQFCTELISDCKWWQLSIEAIQRKSLQSPKRKKKKKTPILMIFSYQYPLNDILRIETHFIWSFDICTTSQCNFIFILHLVSNNVYGADHSGCVV